jgi:tryptophan 2,3-dioxygenase
MITDISVKNKSAYERYLETDKLLSIQPDHLANSEELTFVIVHQASELILKLMSFEVSIAAKAIEDKNIDKANRHLRKVQGCFPALLKNLDLLSYIPPWSYQEIRASLENGSGFSSPGWKSLKSSAELLWKNFSYFLISKNISVFGLYKNIDKYESFFHLSENLLNIDKSWASWRAQHLLIVEHAIGSDAVGTAGTPISILRELTHKRIFPELWEVRTELTKLASSYTPEYFQKSE